MMLCFRALLALLAYDLLNAICRFGTICSIVKRWKVTGSYGGARVTGLICGAVNCACVWYPKQALCLQRSFVTTYLLRKNGISALMVLGAQKLPFRAHAWVEVAGQPVNERSNVQSTYAVLDKY